MTIAESELYEFHREVLRTRTADFGEDFLVRCLPACSLTKGDHIRAAWLQRRMVREWEAIFRRLDVIVTAGSLRTAPPLRRAQADRVLAEALHNDAVQQLDGPCLKRSVGIRPGRPATRRPDCWPPLPGRTGAEGRIRD